jgi:hypothetical protein
VQKWHPNLITEDGSIENQIFYKILSILPFALPTYLIFKVVSPFFTKNNTF